MLLRSSAQTVAGLVLVIDTSCTKQLLTRIPRKCVIMSTLLAWSVNTSSQWLVASRQKCDLAIRRHQSSRITTRCKTLCFRTIHLDRFSRSLLILCSEGAMGSSCFFAFSTRLRDTVSLKYTRLPGVNTRILASLLCTRTSPLDKYGHSPFGS